MQVVSVWDRDRVAGHAGGAGSEQEGSAAADTGIESSSAARREQEGEPVVRAVVEGLDPAGRQQKRVSGAVQDDALSCAAR